MPEIKLTHFWNYLLKEIIMDGRLKISRAITSNYINYNLISSFLLKRAKGQ